MDAVGGMSWREAMLAQRMLVGEQQQRSGKLDAQVNLLTNAVPQPLMLQQNSVAPLSLLIFCPEKFSGETALWKGFLPQCSLYFPDQSGAFDQQKIMQFLSLLTEKATDRPPRFVYSAGSSCPGITALSNSFSAFSTTLKKARKSVNNCWLSFRGEEIPQSMQWNWQQEADGMDQH